MRLNNASGQEGFVFYFFPEIQNSKGKSLIDSSSGFWYSARVFECESTFSYIYRC